jgi:RNA polymerase-binding transcription factor DksA
MEEGEYGICQVCGREIADERLEAVPATRFCREHGGSSAPESDATVSDLEITQELDA